MYRWIGVEVLERGVGGIFISFHFFPFFVTVLGAGFRTVRWMNTELMVN